MEYGALAIAELDKGIHAQGPQWESQRAAALDRFEAAESYEELYGLMSQLASGAGGEHSSFVPAPIADTSRAQYAPGARFAKPTVTSSQGVTTIALPAFLGTEQASIEEYAEPTIESIRAAVPNTSCGWILDLRANRGGNAYAMLAAVGPLLDDGDIVGIRTKAGAETWLRSDDGAVDNPLYETIEAGFTVDGPVAVLTSSSTLSAGEFVATAFQGQADTTRVGKPTGGFTTSNETLTLPDGSLLIVTTGWYLDRTGRLYDEALIPDIVAPYTSAPEEADAWLRATCRDQ
ncbi:S41 family peptidase [Microbacterium stercoris]|uniref:Tail specific protease domain-containing protein n=1 Tax=Microbacterium stercoris TaxID=2820289 RepID=A0A939QPD4_9MICO|nr:S41 family peptidase [Microbacterium stercoris]MBO3662338.1 hypothetical protein [Microbacterium stercoris]MBO3664330.1 hypothetical protein [Microbacterium stercoris]